MKIRIVDQGFKTYSGLFGSVMFENGESVDHVPKMEIDRLSSLIRIETVDGDEVGILKSLDEHHSKEAPVLTPAQTEAEAAADAAAASAETTETPEVPETPEVTEAPDATTTTAAPESAPAAPASAPAATTWTREALEAIADKTGIAGLREIADPLNVKGTSVVKLIEGILATQPA